MITIWGLAPISIKSRSCCLYTIRVTTYSSSAQLSGLSILFPLTRNRSKSLSRMRLYGWPPTNQSARRGNNICNLIQGITLTRYTTEFLSPDFRHKILGNLIPAKLLYCDSIMRPLENELTFGGGTHTLWAKQILNLLVRKTPGEFSILTRL